MKELAENKEELVGVSAEGLPDDLFKVHGNLKAPSTCRYAGAVFHFEMVMPTDYPKHPPTIRLLTPFKHPNVFGDNLCLDMLQYDEKNPKSYEKWVPVYSI